MVGAAPIRAVVFDFGGVLITSITNQVGEVAARHGVSTPTMMEIVLGPHASGDHPWHRAERGELAVADIQPGLQAWADPHGVELHGDEIAAVMRAGGYSIVQPMVEKVATLRRNGVLTALLTNTFAEFRPTMERDLDFDAFSQIVESFAVRARKPEPAIYHATRAMLGVEHHEILYLDDFAQNLDVARSLGWSTIHVRDPLDAVEMIDSYL